MCAFFSLPSPPLGPMDGECSECFQPGQCDASKDKDKTIPVTDTFHALKAEPLLPAQPQKTAQDSRALGLGHIPVLSEVPSDVFAQYHTL